MRRGSGPALTELVVSQLRFSTLTAAETTATKVRFTGQFLVSPANANALPLNRFHLTRA
jgi:hypothetical protein